MWHLLNGCPRPSITTGRCNLCGYSVGVLQGHKKQIEVNRTAPVLPEGSALDHRMSEGPLSTIAKGGVNGSFRGKPARYKRRAR